MSEFREWKSGIVNRNSHILHNLLKQDRIDKILSVDFLPFTKKRALRIYFQSVLKSHGGKRIKQDLTSKLTQISDKLYTYSTIDSLFSEKKVYKKLNKIIKKIFDEDEKLLVWSYFPMFVSYLDYFKNHAVKKPINIFDTVDNWTEHASFQQYKNRLQQNYKTIAKKTDIIFTVSKDLLQLYPQNHHKYWIPNGVDIKHFEKKSDKKMIHAGKPIIGYYGIIEKRLDYDLLKHIAQKNPDKSFVFIGWVWKNADVDELKKLQNVHFLGRKEYQDLPLYLNEFDLAIIPHKISQFTKSMNPIKLYEYLSAGKPIVTTKIAGLERFQDLVYTADTPEQFNQKIQQALQENNQELQQERKQAVKEHTWNHRVDEMLKIIDIKCKK